MTSTEVSWFQVPFAQVSDREMNTFVEIMKGFIYKSHIGIYSITQVS